jgi:glycerophosphoryl diester phosphodiesterase
MELLKLAKERGVLIAAHRGACGGNVPCNSSAAFKAAVNAGADIIELDVDSSSDGELFIQHPGMERVHLRFADSIRNYPASVVEHFMLSNSDLAPTQYGILRFADALELLRGKCIVNIDKFWEHPREIAATVRRLGMEDQVFIKTSNRPEFIDDVERYAPEIPYLTIASGVDTTHEELKKRSINYQGVEALFKTEDDMTASKEYIDMLHADGMIAFGNAIVFNYKTVLSAGHTDDISVSEDPALGWGWLADHGFDVIQTDYTYQCNDYLIKTGRRK